MKPRLILRRVLKPRYPGPWKPGGRTLEEWVAVSTHWMRVADMKIGAYFVIGDRVYKKVGDRSIVWLEEDTSENHEIAHALLAGLVDPRSLDDIVIGRRA